jgi:hypothetical protein
MGRLDFLVPQRVTEATPQMRAATGAGGNGGWDAIDGDYGFRALGSRGGRELPERTREQARADSCAGYRANPLARAVIDTYVAFMVGDAGVTLQCTSDLVRPYAEAFWANPKNRLVSGQELSARSALLNGELLEELMVGELTGVALRSPIDPARIKAVTLLHGNPLWPDEVVLRAGPGEDDLTRKIIETDDLSQLLTGEVLFWPFFRSLETDTRGAPFLMPVLDWLDSYDTVLSNLIDRTALARFIAMDVTLKGSKADPDEFIRQRGGRHIPRSGTIEVHDDQVEWKPLAAQTGSYEDTNTNKAVMTNIAAGAGLAKTWLSEPEDANRATSLTMAEPVRRRVGSVQNEYVACRTFLVRYAIDQLVAAGTLPATVEVHGPGGVRFDVPTSSTVSIVGPQVAAADAQVTARVMAELSRGLNDLVSAGVMSREAAQEAARKAWTDYMGTPYRAELDDPEADPDDVATAVDDAGGGLPT